MFEQSVVCMVLFLLPVINLNSKAQLLDFVGKVTREDFGISPHAYIIYSCVKHEKRSPTDIINGGLCTEYVSHRDRRDSHESMDDGLLEKE